MKKVLMILAVVVGLNAQAVTLTQDRVQEGQVLSVIGWKNMMPGPGKKPSLGTSHSVTVSFIAFSGGCTNEDSFDVKLVNISEYDQVTEETKLVYKVEVVRVVPDFCEAIFAPQVFSKSVSAPIEAFTQGAEFLSQPYTSVGVAY
jgi:hypothetical protein